MFTNLQFLCPGQTKFHWCVFASLTGETASSDKKKIEYLVTLLSSARMSAAILALGALTAVPAHAAGIDAVRLG